MSGPELIDGITFLYNKYGTAKAVHDATGIPYADVRNYVKYPRLMPALKEIVDDGEVDIKVALRAQDAVEVDDVPPKEEEAVPPKEEEAVPPKEEEAVKLAREMKSMSDAQRKKVVKERQERPESTVDDVIEQARTSSRITQVVVTLSQDAHSALQRYAKDQDLNQDEAAGGIIEETLKSHGFLDE